MRFTIAFVTGGLPFTGDSLVKGSLGGSETALIYVAQSLAKLGHLVHVFCQCKGKEGEFDGVTYINVENFETQLAVSGYDILIASRWPEFLRMKGNVGLRVLWNHDTLADSRDRFMGAMYQADLSMFLSEYHIKNYEAKISEVRDFSWQTKNGIDPVAIKKALEEVPKKDPNKIIYTSRPERGLHFLLGGIFPRLIEKKPDIKLYYSNYDVSKLELPGHVKQVVQLSDSLAEQYPKNVFKLGHLTKEELYKEMASATLMVYPTNFPEISCISAIEAQALGVPVITTKDFALTETVGPGCGVFIDGNPASEEYADEFANKTLELLADTEELEYKRTACQAWVKDQGYEWDKIAQSWINKFTEMMEERWKTRRPAIIKQLQLQGDWQIQEILQKKFIPQETDPICQTELLEYFGYEARQPGPNFKEQLLQAQPLFNEAVKFYELAEKKPKKILDYECGFISLGLIFKKAFPDAEMVFASSDPMAVVQMEKNLERMQWGDCAAVEAQIVTSLKDTYDLIVIHELDIHKDPQGVLERVTKKLNPDGHLLVTSRFGDQAPTYRKLQEALPQDLRGKRWNLGMHELQDIFKDCTFFRAKMFAEDVTESGNLQSHWITLVQPPKTFGKVNIERKRLTTRPYESLCLCMIADDQEANITGALESCKDVVDHIVLVDNRKEGSVDRTPEIAERYGAEIRRVVFDNFAQVRNESVRDVKEDWIFWMDTDERLVEPENVKKYLTGRVFNGFAIKQVHLTVDNLNCTFDVPVRFYRNVPYYKFNGLIHEHAYDTRRRPADDPISPALLLPDAQLAHFGYINERFRRQKCSNRNMELLQRDATENTRVLTQVLLLRDMLNITKWDGERTKSIHPGSPGHRRLEAAIKVFLENFADPSHQYHGLSFGMYQEALMFLGQSGLSYGDNPFPPFEVGFSLIGAMGGIQSTETSAQKIWFINHQQFLDYITKQGQELVVKLGLAKEEEYDLKKSAEMEVYGMEAVTLLGAGINAIK